MLELKHKCVGVCIQIPAWLCLFLSSIKAILHNHALHLVPVLKDYEFKLTESRAIACFLANSDKKGFKIYPIDPLERAHVDQYLYMDATYVVPTIVRNIIVSCAKMSQALFTASSHIFRRR